MALKRNILIVDDESTILNFLKDGLRMYQDRLNVFTAAGVDGALGIVETQRIDLITTDIRMPGMDGFELIGRSRKKNPDTRFIVMTAYSCEEYFQKSKNFGIIDYIRKPFEEGSPDETRRQMMELIVDIRRVGRNVGPTLDRLLRLTGRMLQTTTQSYSRPSRWTLPMWTFLSPARSATSLQRCAWLREVVGRSGRKKCG